GTPCLMCCGGKTDNGNGCPDISSIPCKYNRHDQNCDNEQGCLTGFQYLPSVFNKIGRKVSASDTTESSSGIDNSQMNAWLFQIQIKSGSKIGRQPEKEKPPDRICQHFSNNKHPGLF